MNKKMIWTLIALIIILGAALYAWYWSQNNRIAPPIDRGPTINKICYEVPQNSQVSIYKDTSGNIGGYFASPTETIPGWNGTLYDSSGAIIAQGDSTPPFTRTREMTEMRDKIRVNFPLEEKISCMS